MSIVSLVIAPTLADMFGTGPDVIDDVKIEKNIIVEPVATSVDSKTVVL